ncbi:unnamed protein product [Ostreobium quekettii]|uniref:Uncharacterized protein n=1 Tax=Ostreobium quekettii TaxID=121088 RepID=A0A8S1INZ0_9CHLO|nr:unnamed protein product [Ostreobium quekettii]
MNKVLPLHLPNSDGQSFFAASELCHMAWTFTKCDLHRKTNINPTYGQLIPFPWTLLAVTNHELQNIQSLVSHWAAAGNVAGFYPLLATLARYNLWRLSTDQLIQTVCELLLLGVSAQNRNKYPSLPRKSGTDLNS